MWTFKFQSKQPVLNYFFERFGEFCSTALRKLGLLTARTLPMVSSILARIQFFTQWSICKNRSDFIHTVPRPWNPIEACRGSCWLLPANKLPEVIGQISQWTHYNPNMSVAPLFVQTVKIEKSNLKGKKPFLSPVPEEPSCSVWYDWFL